MNKQSLYIAFFNALFGVVLSLLLKGSLLIYVITFLIFLTIIFIERKWIYDTVFKHKKGRAIVGYVVMICVMVGFLVLITRPNRDMSMILSSTHRFIDHLRPGEYDQAYEVLSETSKLNYPKNDFISDQENFHVHAQEVRIDEVNLNEYDSKKALVKISTPFLLYGQNHLSLDMVKENGEWRMAFSPKMAERPPNASVSENSADTKRDNGTDKSKEKRRPGAVRRFFHKVF
ncbi:MAG: hypothetical protein U1F57_10880 [bacterium]